MRRALADTLIAVAAENPRLVFLTGDLGFGVFDAFKEKYGPRYVNVGVAEAQLVLMAAGLALESWRPIVYSIASFATGRAFEQIRISINYPNLPVVVIGAGGGYTYGSAGVTHHSVDDLALMSMLSNMTVVAPGDPDEVAQLLPQLLQLPGPSYMRIGKFGETVCPSSEPATLGRARLLRAGERCAIICTGHDTASQALVAADRLVEEGIVPMVYQMHTVKPVDLTTLDRLAESVDTIIVVEEHIPSGGLASSVFAWRTTRNSGPAIRRVGPPAALALGNYDRNELRTRLAYGVDAIVNTCRAAWNGLVVASAADSVPGAAR